jgi:hypothetical protein
MESHPEEFGPKGDQRWLDYLHQMDAMLTEEERLMLRSNRMQEIHEGVLDELLNGPDKRRKEKEDHEYERNLTKSFALTKQQMMQQAQGSLQNAYANQLGAYNQAQAVGLTGQSPTNVWVDESADIGTTGTLTNTINQIKEMLGAKK